MPRPARHPHNLRHRFHYYNQASRKYRFISLFLVTGFLTLAVIFFRSSFSFHPPAGQSISQIPWTTLLGGAASSLTRLFVAYLVSLVLAVILGILVTSHKRVENLTLPILDVLQSVPVLAFFPIAVLAFSRVGSLEGAAIFILITAMLWPILFTVIGAIHSMPLDIKLAARNFGATRFKYIYHVILPAVLPAVITGSILAWGQGWNIIIVAEFINFGTVKAVLPGLGSILDEAAAGVGEGNTVLFLAALLVLVGLVVLLNRLIWQPLLNFSERFKFD